MEITFEVAVNVNLNYIRSLFKKFALTRQNKLWRLKSQWVVNFTFNSMLEGGGGGPLNYRRFCDQSWNFLRVNSYFRRICKKCLRDLTYKS